MKTKIFKLMHLAVIQSTLLDSFNDFNDATDAAAENAKDDSTKYIDPFLWQIRNMSHSHN